MNEPLWYELRNTVFARDFDKAAELLRTKPDLVSMRNGIGETVLHFLAVEDDAEGVAWLFARGFDLNVKDEFGTPTVFSVALLGYEKLLLWFIEKSADLNAKNGEGQDIESYLAEFEKPQMINFIRAHAPPRPDRRG